MVENDGSSALRRILCPSVDVPCRLFVSGPQSARVIGKGGTQIRELRESSAAYVDVLEKQLPVAFQNRDERVILLKGESDAIRTLVGTLLRLIFPSTGNSGDRDDPHVRSVEMMVPETSTAHLIGEKGARIRQLSEETQCDLHVVREPVSGLSGQKRLRMTGPSLRDLEFALSRVHEILVDLTRGGVIAEREFELKEGPTAPADLVPRDRGEKDGVAVNLLLGKEETAWMIGKKGIKIGRLREMAKVSANDAQVPPFEPYETIVEIAGAPLREQLRVLGLIIDDLMMRSEAVDSTRLLVPTEHFGAVMGHGGSVLSQIADDTGARFQQEVPMRSGGREYPLRVLEVLGSERERLSAAAAVYERVQQACETSGTASQPPSVSQDTGPMMQRESTNATVVVNSFAASSRSDQVGKLSSDFLQGSSQTGVCGHSPAPAADDGGGGGLIAGRIKAKPNFSSGPTWNEIVESKVVENKAHHDSFVTTSVTQQVNELEPPKQKQDMLGSNASANGAPLKAPLNEAQRTGSMATRIDTACHKPAYESESTFKGAAVHSASTPGCRVLGVPAQHVSKGTDEHVTSEALEPMNRSNGGVTVVNDGKFELFLALPTLEIASFLASDNLGIARRTGAEIASGRGPQGEIMLRVHGAPAVNATALYHIQEALWLSGAYGHW